MEFMTVNSKAAMKKRARMESLKDLSDDSKAKKGSKVVAAAVDTSKVKSSGKDDVQSLDDKQKEKYNSLKQKSGLCKICKELHTFQSRWTHTPLPSDRFLNCPKFKNISARARG